MSKDFHLFGKAVEARFKAISAGELYVVDASDLFETYLSAYPEGSNPIFRERTEHDCSCCKQFVRNIGHVVAISPSGELQTVWDGMTGLPWPYAEVAVKMAAHVRALPIRSIFRTKEGKFGAPYSDELIDNRQHRWHHFNATVPSKFIHAAPAQEVGAINTSMGVFHRGLEELTERTLEQILDLIEANALYRGAEFKANVQGFLKLKREYVKHLDNIQVEQAWLWSHIRDRNALFRNTVIGTLAVDLDNGMSLEAAVRSFEQKVAPMNYKRPTALITPKMIEEGLGKLRDMGLESAVQRRFAKISDVSVNNVLFVDNHVRGQMKGGLAGLLMESVRPATVSIKHAEEISMDDFLKSVVPTAESIELNLESRHLANFMSVTAPVDPNAGQLFKWNNGFAWSYDGDAADSIKARVKRAGGNVEADLRVSLAWFNTDDLDLHVVEPNGNRIYFGNKGTHLDVDMNNGFRGSLVRDPVENCVWTGQLRDGNYMVEVHNYRQRDTQDVGFTLELDFRGAVQHFQLNRALRHDDTLRSLTLHVKGGELVRVDAHTDFVRGASSQDKWGLKTEQLVRVNTLMASPNHWDGQEIGNKHWFFILEGCHNPDQARGIYNEFLKSELDPHRKVFEVLGAKTKCPPAAEQLSGVGFSSTRGDTASVVVRRGTANQAFNIRF